MDKEAIEKIGTALQRKFNFDRAMYLRHPERDEYFNEMAGEALYQAEKLGWKPPKEKPPLLRGANEQTTIWMKAQREADIKFYEG